MHLHFKLLFRSHSRKFLKYLQTRCLSFHGPLQGRTLRNLSSFIGCNGQVSFTADRNDILIHFVAWSWDFVEKIQCSFFCHSKYICASEVEYRRHLRLRMPWLRPINQSQAHLSAFGYLEGQKPGRMFSDARHIWIVFTRHSRRVYRA